MIQSGSLKYCRLLTEALLYGVKQRLGQHSEFDASANNFIIAAISHLFLKFVGYHKSTLKNVVHCLLIHVFRWNVK